MLRKAFCAVFMTFMLANALAGMEIAFVDGKTEFDQFMYARDNTTRIPYKTSFCMTNRGSALHIRCYAETPYVKEFRKLKTKKYNTWNTVEGFEFFLDVSGIGKGYIQLWCGVDGGMWDSRLHGTFDTEKAYKWQRKITFTDKAWILELTIPYSALNTQKPETGSKWKFNICRNINNPVDRYFSTFAHVGSNFHNPASFALLTFGSPAEATAAEKAKFRKQLTVLQNDLKKKGLLPVFQARLKLLQNGAPISMIQEMYDEAYLLERINKK